MKKAQAFTTFKLLIGAVLAVALLFIVYSVSQPETPFPGIQLIQETLTKASKAPEKCITREKVQFTKGEKINLESYSASHQVTLTRPDAAAGLFDCNGPLCSVKETTTVPISAKCDKDGPCTVYLASAQCQQ